MFIQQHFFMWSLLSATNSERSKLQDSGKPTNKVHAMLLILLLTNWKPIMFWGGGIIRVLRVTMLMECAKEKKALQQTHNTHLRAREPQDKKQVT